MLLFTLVIIISCSAFVGWQIGRGIIQNPFTKERHLSSVDLKIATDIIETHYANKYNYASLISSTLENLLKNLNDPYSYFVKKDDYRKIKQQDNGEIYGIGILYRFENNVIKIIDVYPQSPAEKSGLKPGQQILALNGRQASQFTSPEEADGFFQKNSNFSLTMENGQTIQVSKSNFISPIFVYKKINDKISYLKIYWFTGNFEVEYKKISQQLSKDKSYKLIIDLRNNLGGEINNVIFLSDQFLDQGVIVEEKLKKDNEDIIHKASGKAPFKNLSLIILTNSETSSGAEVLAAAIKDNKRGVLVGEKTYGKGTTGQFFELDDGSAIHLTIGQWMTPNGQSIENVGVSPDYSVKDVVVENEDQILKKALTL